MMTKTYVKENNCTKIHRLRANMKSFIKVGNSPIFLHYACIPVCLRMQTSSGRTECIVHLIWYFTSLQEDKHNFKRYYEPVDCNNPVCEYSCPMQTQNKTIYMEFVKGGLKCHITYSSQHWEEYHRING